MGDKKFGAIILAAGFSSRMGRFKPLLPLGDKTVIERVIAMLKAVGIQEILVVSGYNRESLSLIILREKVKEVFNPRFEEGMFTSIQAGVAALPYNLSGFFIVPVDCPLMPRGILVKMMKDFDPDRFTVPCYRGKKGHPLLVPERFRWDILKHDGEGGLKAITDKDFNLMNRMETDFEGIVMDMDTPKAYKELQEYLKRGCVSEDLLSLAQGRRFFLIRHGQIRQHREKIFLGQTNVPLSEEGKRQAQEAGQVLSGYRLETDCIYSSDLLRASETAEIIKAETGISSLVLNKGFREMNLGPWDGKYIREIRETMPQEYEKRGKNLMIYKMGHGSENFFDLQYRVVKALKEMLKKDRNRDVILIAHSGVLRVICNNLEGKDVSDPWQKMKNGQVRLVNG